MNHKTDEAIDEETLMEIIKAEASYNNCYRYDDQAREQI